MGAALDRRRRMWVAVQVDLLRSPLGTRLQRDFGPAGVAVWVAFLAACKRSPLEGRISFGSVAEAWQLLGFLEPPLDLDAFFKTTGALKETRRSRYGQLTEITCTRWGELQQPRRRPAADQQPPSLGAINVAPMRRRSDSIARPDIDIDKDKDIDKGRALRLGDLVHEIPAGEPLRIDEGERRRQIDALAALSPPGAAR